MASLVVRLLGPSSENDNILRGDTVRRRPPPFREPILETLGQSSETSKAQISVHSGADNAVMSLVWH